MSELQALKLLRRVDEGVAGKTGEAFFRQIVRELAGALNAHAAFTSRLLPDRRARMLAFWVEDHYEQCLDYSLAGTPCEYVYAGKITAYARDIGNVFPVDREWFASLGVHSYLGIPVTDESGAVYGHLAVMDTRERDWRDADIDTLRLFSVRSAAELERVRYERELEQTNEQLRQEIELRRRAEIELAAAKLAAEDANRAKSAFISQMSHELRTPLNGILGYAQLLRRSAAALPSDHLEGLSIIERSGEHLLQLVNELLDLARIEAGRLELALRKVDLDELLEHVANLARIRAAHAELEFECRIADAVPREITTDARALRQILLNLLGNAIKFTPRGGRVVLHVTNETANTTTQRLRLLVRDTGPGIAPEHVARIFEPFYRVSPESGVVEGTGLGLTITHRLVSALGGEIALRSAVGDGSEFTVELPIVTSEAQHESARSQSRVVGGYGGAHRRVLVADDDETSANLVAQFLGSLDFDVETVPDGRKALAAIQAHAPDVIVTDLVMPHMSGFDLIRALRAESSTRHVPIIALSASAGETAQQEAITAGCAMFLPKPLDLDRLLGAIRASLESGTSDERAESPASAFKLDSMLAGELYDLAMEGDLTSLVATARERLDDVPDAREIYLELCALAECYDTAAIRRVLQAHCVHKKEAVRG